ncbi:MAG: caspase domain-containing protein [Acidimicrobiia bacterium]
MGGYRALLIGNSSFPADPHNLRPLTGPVNDIAVLRAALTDPAVGLFEPESVRLVPERTAPEILVELERFFSAARRDDTLLLYYSGHGLLNERNQLFLCARDTRTDLLKSTAVGASSINLMFEESAARTTVIVLDCCHSGAFKSGNLTESLRGSGRFLLTSCRSSDLASDATRENATSVFTDHLVKGLLAGADDSDRDGYVDLSDLYDYVYQRLQAEQRQIPQRSFAGGGDVAIARREVTATKGVTPAPPVPAAPEVEPPPVPPPPVAAPPDRPSGRTRAWVAAAALAALGVVVALALILGGDGDGDARVAPTTEATVGGEVTRTTVGGSQAWKPVLHLVAGQEVVVEASGTILHDVAQGRSAGPDGDLAADVQRYNVVPDFPHGGLIGRIGVEGRPFGLGAREEFASPDSGVLYLQVNDLGLDSNGGEFQVTVRVR